MVIVYRSMFCDGRVRLYTMNGADWSERYPLIVEAAGRFHDSLILDAEVVWLDSNGMAVFDALHSRVNDQNASACAFDLLMLDGDDMRRKPYVERKAALRKLLRHGRGIQYVEHAEGHGDKRQALRPVVHFEKTDRWLHILRAPRQERPPPVSYQFFRIGDAGVRPRRRFIDTAPHTGERTA